MNYILLLLLAVSTHASAETSYWDRAERIFTKAKYAQCMSQPYPSTYSTPHSVSCRNTTDTAHRSLETEALAECMKRTTVEGFDDCEQVFYFRMRFLAKYLDTVAKRKTR